MVECPACGASIRARMADAPEPGPDVRVEWGVRWGSLYANVMCPTEDEEHARKWVAGLRKDPDSSDAAVYRRTVTTTPWEEA